MKKRLLRVFLPIIMCMALCTHTLAGVKSHDTWISNAAQKACVDYGNEYGICPELIMAIIETESSGNPNAKNGTCTGLMQVSSRWHADYLAELIGEHGDVATALMVYHGESDALSKAENGIVSSYASKILERSAELERLHNK